MIASDRRNVDDSPSLLAFDFQLRCTAHRLRLPAGLGSSSVRTIDALGELASELGAARAGRQRSRRRLRPGIPHAGIDCAGRRRASRRICSTASHENPDDRRRRRRRRSGSRRYEPELLVGLGGGSSMDCAKGINFLYTNGGEMQDYWGVGKATQADAADDRRAHHRRHRQRDAVVRPDLATPRRT